MQNINIRKASETDIDLLIKLRLDYINADFDRLTADEENKLKAQLSGYFTKYIDTEYFIAVLADDGVACRACDGWDVHSCSTGRDDLAQI